MVIQTINPATEAYLHRYDLFDNARCETLIKNGYYAYLNWKNTPFSTRADLMNRMADALKSRQDELALLISEEMGKPIIFARAEIKKCAEACTHFAAHAQAYLAPRYVATEMKLSKVCYEPLGIIFGLTPWNFPFGQVFHFAVATLMAGNAVVFKHAPNTTGCGARIEALFQDVGFGPHLVQQLVIDNDSVAQIIEHPSIAAVSFTGSSAVGRIIGSYAGLNLKKSVLELGGCDPYLVLEDANLDLAADCIVTSRLNNSGQVCIAAKRVIVLESVHEELVHKIQNKMALFKLGDPLDPDTQLGPLARKDLRDKLHQQVEKTVKQGAKLLCGGIIPKGKGYYYPPTLITGIKPGMIAFDEELFGPVIAVCSVTSEEEAIESANKSVYGLGAAVFTQNLEKGEYLATQKIEAGVCHVNSFVASDSRLPFGGIKQSGYGRELSQEGILQFVNIKTISISVP